MIRPVPAQYRRRGAVLAAALAAFALAGCGGTPTHASAAGSPGSAAQPSDSASASGPASASPTSTSTLSASSQQFCTDVNSAVGGSLIGPDANSIPAIKAYWKKINVIAPATIKSDVTAMEADMLAAPNATSVSAPTAAVLVWIAGNCP